MSLGGRDDIYPAANAYVAPTPASGGRNRYAEIMANYQQAQPFSFTGMPSTYTGGFNANPSTYTGGFTPYQRLVTPQPMLPVEGTTSATAGGGGGGANREAPSAWSQMTPAERAAYYAANPTEGSIALGMQDLLGNATLMGQIGKYFGADNWYDSRLEKQGLDPESFAYGPPDPNFSSTKAAAARQEAQIAAVNAANLEGAGLVANPMAQDPAQRVQAADAAETQNLLNRYPAPVAPPAPVVTAPPVVAPMPVQMMNVTETYQGEDPNPPGGWTQVRTGKDTYKHIRTVSVPAETRINQEDGQPYTVPVGYTGGGGGSQRGGESVGGYAPGSQAAAAAASGQFGMGPGTPGFNSGGANFAKGGYVSMQHLGGPDPEGPDDGYAALKDGEFVINDKAVKKYGIELMNLINSGKISKGKLRGLLEM